RMAGGITLKEKNKETTTFEDQSKGLAINNVYSYVVAIILQQNETKVHPDLKLLGVKPAQLNARNVINVSLQNRQADYLKQLHLIN
ncbi:WxL protein host-binding domain-containing protein, partial [Enterococcus faecalis]|uniref:WxL protein host-binding domain-containing protein n=1 Tax=Enterococcus faecalis TaxID=1351 RepID=UPI003D6A54C8